MTRSHYLGFTCASQAIPVIVLLLAFQSCGRPDQENAPMSPGIASVAGKHDLWVPSEFRSSSLGWLPNPLWLTLEDAPPHWFTGWKNVDFEGSDDKDPFWHGGWTHGTEDELTNAEDVYVTVSNGYGGIRFQFSYLSSGVWSGQGKRFSDVRRAGKAVPIQALLIKLE